METHLQSKWLIYLFIFDLVVNILEAVAEVGFESGSAALTKCTVTSDTPHTRMGTDSKGVIRSKPWPSFSGTTLKLL